MKKQTQNISRWLAETVKTNAQDLLELAGSGLIVAGVALVWIPAALVVAGIALLVIAHPITIRGGRR